MANVKAVAGMPKPSRTTGATKTTKTTETDQSS